MQEHWEDNFTHNNAHYYPMTDIPAHCLQYLCVQGRDINVFFFIHIWHSPLYIRACSAFCWSHCDISTSNCCHGVECCCCLSSYVNHTQNAAVNEFVLTYGPSNGACKWVSHNALLWKSQMHSVNDSIHWYLVYMNSSNCEQIGHHCRLVQCLQKQEGSPKCIAH